MNNSSDIIKRAAAGALLMAGAPLARRAYRDSKRYAVIKREIALSYHNRINVAFGRHTGGGVGARRSNCCAAYTTTRRRLSKTTTVTRRQSYRHARASLNMAAYDMAAYMVSRGASSLTGVPGAQARGIGAAYGIAGQLLYAAARAPFLGVARTARHLRRALRA